MKYLVTDAELIQYERHIDRTMMHAEKQTISYYFYGPVLRQGKL